MKAPHVTFADWRAQVEKDLAGRSFDKALVTETSEGIAIQPLYIEAPAIDSRGGESRFRICMQHAAKSDANAIVTDAENGADALWLSMNDVPDALSREERARLLFVFAPFGPPANAIEKVAKIFEGIDNPGFLLSYDPIAPFIDDRDGAKLSQNMATLASMAPALKARFGNASLLTISTLPYHERGADAADEIAIALSVGVRYLEALRDAGVSANDAKKQITLRIATGRDTFLELCKVRALRTCWGKLLGGAGAESGDRTNVHSVCSPRTVTTRDPWVNMLRVATQVFAAALGGADLITPSAFDAAFMEPSMLGRRVARNTGLVLREESFLGKVQDAAGGSYYLDTLTNALAREGWSRFRKLEAKQGIIKAIESGELFAELESKWQARAQQIAKRRVPILGVSEFANTGEKLPGAAPSIDISTTHHRDAEAFEALRVRADRSTDKLEIVLSTLGPLAESRARASFASGFFAAGGISSHESAIVTTAKIACICGSDDRYATDAVARARSLKRRCQRVLVAGRPGALEKDLREAGVDGFIFVGCDLVATLSDLLTTLMGSAS
jgi:methylmalonyl-CoA mutase